MTEIVSFSHRRDINPIRILFIYPNTYGMNMLPPAIALFNALLKRDGHEVDIFDATYYSTDYGNDSDGSKADNLNVVPYDEDEIGIRRKETYWLDDIKDKVVVFQPDLIAISSTEDMWQLGILLLEGIRSYKLKNNTPVIAGGVFPTFAPEIAIQHSLVDMVCVGEGENALLDLCYRIGNKKSYDDVTNLWVKRDGSLIKNDITSPVDINDTPIIDVTLFEEKRLYRPMAGKWYKMLPIETIRGCPYKCAYCNSPTQVDMYRNKLNSNFFRKKSADLVYKEAKYFKEDLGAEYLYFWADTFLAMNNREFDQFCEMYKDIGLPFWMQTRPETLTDEKIKRLADVGLHRISFGVEHGNEVFRKKYLARSFKNKDLIEKLKIPHNYGVQFSVNNITGFPNETRELAMDTVELNRHIESDNQNLYAFVPFHGTPLRKLSEDLGLVDKGEIVRCLTNKPMLNQVQYPAEEVEGLQKCFALYVKFPKSRWPEIRRAEKNDDEGGMIFESLKNEYMDTYMPSIDGTEDELNMGSKAADLEYGITEIQSE
jgi:anaerobic magnesium-protoporphyrin IX monomethyl ester cyclase